MKSPSIIRPLSSLRQTALQRPPGYLDDCLRHGQQVGSLVEFTPEAFAYLRKKYSAPRKHIQGVTFPPPGIRGLGDLVHKFALPIAKALHLDCVDPATGGLKPASPCERRRAAWNAAVPNLRQWF